MASKQVKKSENSHFEMTAKSMCKKAKGNRELK